MHQDTSMNLVQFHIHKQIGNTFITGFEVKPSATVTSDATKGWIYVPVDHEASHDCIHIEYCRCKLPDYMQPANLIVDYIANQSGAEK
jgi:hypothetical protein